MKRQCVEEVKNSSPTTASIIDRLPTCLMRCILQFLSLRELAQSRKLSVGWKVHVDAGVGLTKIVIKSGIGLDMLNRTEIGFQA